MRIEIQFINKHADNSAYEKISHIGGKDLNGNNWKMTQEEAINHIENKTREFYVSKDGKTANVVIRRNVLGFKYIRTVSDDTSGDNLLSLPECP
jgi:hypothetical protein